MTLDLGDGSVVNGPAFEAGEIEGTNEEDVSEVEYATDSEFETASSEEDDEDM